MPAPSSSRARVWFIDDDEDLRAVIAGELRASEFEVIECVCVEDARRKIESILPEPSRWPSLFIVDNRLSDGFGADLIHWIRGRAVAHAGWQRIPILFLTADTAAIERLPSHEVNAIMEKPFGLNELFKQIEQLTKMPQ